MVGFAQILDEGSVEVVPFWTRSGLMIKVHNSDIEGRYDSITEQEKGPKKADGVGTGGARHQEVRRWKSGREVGREGGED